MQAKYSRNLLPSNAYHHCTPEVFRVGKRRIRFKPSPVFVSFPRVMLQGAAVRPSARQGRVCSSTTPVAPFTSTAAVGVPPATPSTSCPPWAFSQGTKSLYEALGYAPSTLLPYHSRFPSQQPCRFKEVFWPTAASLVIGLDETTASSALRVREGSFNQHVDPSIV